ncbi:hypothetical protein Tco_0794616 [Tanacetum coccineum]
MKRSLKVQWLLAPVISRQLWVSHVLTRYSREKVLSFDLIHPHWRIDTLTLNPEDVSHNDGADPFVKLLDVLNAKYKAWPLHKKETATMMITNRISQSDMLFEPVI